MKNVDRRQFLQVMGAGAMTSLNANIAKALSIPASRRTGTLQDVQHIVVLTQENNSFDKYFGTMRGVRGFADPRAATIHLPLADGSGTTPASVFLQPAGAANTAAGYGVPPNYGTLGGPAGGANVLPPFRVNPAAVSPGLTGLGGTYLPGTSHSWKSGHAAWNLGQWDNWLPSKGPMTMAYVTRDDLPLHYALADAFTVCDAYHCSIMGPTNPNRCYIWSGCVGNVDYLGAAGTDGLGAGPITYNGLSVNNAYLSWKTLPESLEAAGVSWRIYQDLAGATFAPDFGDGTNNSFAGNYTDNSVLYFKQYADSAPGTPLFDKGCTGTQVSNTLPATGSPDSAWKAWAEQLFDDFRKDVQNGTLPQVSWVVAPAGYTEHSSYPANYGAWYIAQIFDILVANPDVWSKTVFLINYDENDGGFDHLVSPTPPQSSAYGASTADFHNEIVTTSTPNGPIGLGVRVPFLAISPWSKGGYVNSQVFDHTSVVQFIEKRFGLTDSNINPWRRTVSGDLTSVFDFANPDDSTHVKLPSTDAFLPSAGELAGTDLPTFVPTPAGVILGVPQQEKGVRPARALPYELDVHGSLHGVDATFHLHFINTGKAGAVFMVRSGNAVDTVRTYTVEPGKQLSDSWAVNGSYDLSVHGPNGFFRRFKGSDASGASSLVVRSSYGTEGNGKLEWSVSNTGAGKATVTVLDAYSGRKVKEQLDAQESMDGELSLETFRGWYDLVISVAEDSTLLRRLAGHVETGRNSWSDPAMGGLVNLKA